jgi:hypothetical protein
MFERAITHWKTTLLGAISATCAVGVPLIVSGTVAPTEIYVAIGLTFVGALCKDPGKTDG